MSDAHEDAPGVSTPATRLLDALGRGDLNALLDEFRPTTIVRTEDHAWAVQGEDDVIFWLEQAFDRFPGLVFDSHARHIGYGQVIEEARVRDIGVVDTATAGPADGAVESAKQGSENAAGQGGALVLDREFGKSDTPRLNMPVRVTVLHDDRFVHEIIASYPRALLRSALGLHVDPLDMAVSEIQSAFVAPAGSGFKTYQMGDKPAEVVPMPIVAPAPVEVHARNPEPEPEPVATMPVEDLFAPATQAEPGPEHSDDEGRPEPLVRDEDERPRRRALVVVPLVMVLVAAIAASTWWLGRDNGAADQAGNRPNKPNHSANQGGRDDPKPTKKPSSASSTPAKPVSTKPDKPTVTLRSDLAFAKNSAALSGGARSAIAKIADQVRAAKLRGTIYIHGYTDNLGSDAHGLELSQQRASAVARHLRSSLNGYKIAIVAVGHGEANPIASNATEAGRQKNRRVTITLPKR